MTSPTTKPGFESPSLLSGNGGSAYELKFLIDESTALEVENWGRQNMQLDPHGDPALGGAYCTTTLYTDTPEFDVYHKSRQFKRSKFRVRRYGDADWLFAERKLKGGDRVKKRRSVVADHEVARFASPTVVESWPGDWFHQQLITRRLAPVCRISYDRPAFSGMCADGPLRMTFDRNVRCILTSDWGVEPFQNGLSLLAGHVILELKFQGFLPHPFREVIQRWNLVTSSVSKYRLCCDAWKNAPPRNETARID